MHAKVTVDGGVVSCSHIASAATHAAETANLSFGGGAEVYATHLVAGGTTVSGANVATDKEISPTTLLLGDCRLHCATTYCYLHVGAQSTQDVGRVVFDGCKMDPCNGTNYKWYLKGNGLGTSEIIIRGSQNELYFQHMEGTNALIRYVFDASRDHISPLRYERTGHPEAVGPIGVLDLQVDGGAMLTAGSSFDLIVSAAAMNLAQRNYSSTPWSRGSTLWSGTLAENGKRYRVTLNVDAERAPGSEKLAFGTARTTGAVAIPVGATDDLESLQVRLNLENATDERLAALVDALRAAGYPASAADKAKTGYDLTVSFSAGQVTPNAANYFVWDFTSAGAASVKVTSLKVVEKRPAVRSYIHFR